MMVKLWAFVQFTVNGNIYTRAYKAMVKCQRTASMTETEGKNGVCVCALLEYVLSAF